MQNSLGGSGSLSSQYSQEHPFLKPTGDCVVMKDDTYGSVVWRQFQRFAEADKGYHWYSMDQVVDALPQETILGISRDVIQGKIRNNEGDFLTAMINKCLIEIDESGERFRIHATHHKDGLTFLD